MVVLAACAVGAVAGAPRWLVTLRDASGVPMPVTISLPLCNTGGCGQPLGRYDSYLVDSASSHMLVSKIKPCKSKFKQLNRETANGSLNQLSYI